VYRIYPGITGTREIAGDKLETVKQGNETADDEERGVEPVGGSGTLKRHVEKKGENEEEMKDREDHVLVHLWRQEK